MTMDTMTKQKVSLDVEIDEVLNAATLGSSPHLVGPLQKQSKQNAFTISKYILAMNTEINPALKQLMSTDSNYQDNS